ncbi:MAG: ribosomal-protein-serine acetyltransferase [Sorangium cellulosum]|nr:MAG: ribosomal-protein-serine acetyltransferase [Sorangium cellulosum]
MVKLPPRASLRTSPINSKRLQLFPIDRADSRELWLAIEESRDYLYRWLPWVPLQQDETASARFTEACVADWDAGRALRMIIRERDTGTFIGVVSLETCVHMHASCEMGYWLRQPAQGHGYMTEASAALLEVAFESFGMHRVRVAAATTNHKSLAVIMRLGFPFEGIAREAEYCAGRWLDHAQFGMLASDFKRVR